MWYCPECGYDDGDCKEFIAVYGGTCTPDNPSIVSVLNIAMQMLMVTTMLNLAKGTAEIVHKKTSPLHHVQSI